MKIICCNFKMNLLHKDIKKYLCCIDKKINNQKVIFFPSIPYIKDFKDNGYIVGSQNISFKEFGSITGDTSILQLKELGISYTIIGHSERRKYFNDDEYISKKIELALKNNIKVILCIGESEKTTMEKTNEYLKKQIDIAIIDNKKLITNDNLIIAYEPIWAIGSGIIPDNNCLDATVSFIKNYITKAHSLNLKVLYGGSVKKDNIETLEKIKNIDGYLIGGACLNPEEFLSLQAKIK